MSAFMFRRRPPAVTFEGEHEWTYLDVKRSRLLPVRQDIPEGFDEGLTPMNAGSIWGYVDESGAFIMPPSSMKQADSLKGSRQCDSG